MNDHLKNKTIPENLGRLRLATESDIPRINLLVNGAYRGEYAKKGWTSEAHILGGQRTDEMALLDELRLKGSFFYLLEADPKAEESQNSSSFEKKLQACILIQIKQDFAYFGMITVDPGSQNQGLGRLVLENAEKIIERFQIRKIKMYVISERQELIDWYLRRGYILNGEREAFPSSNPRFGVPLKSNLEFVVLEKTYEVRN